MAAFIFHAACFPTPFAPNNHNLLLFCIWVTNFSSATLYIRNYRFFLVMYISSVKKSKILFSFFILSLDGFNYLPVVLDFFPFPHQKKKTELGERIATFDFQLASNSYSWKDFV